MLQCKYKKKSLFHSCFAEVVLKIFNLHYILKLISDDTRCRREVIKKVVCLPIYWKSLESEILEMDICKSSDELRKLQIMISSHRKKFMINGRSCITMDNLVFRTNEYEPDSKHLTIKISYVESTYQETENVKEFPFESFFSSLGGFIGIFLGYSMLQIPEILSGIPFLALKFMNFTLTGKIANFFNKS